MKKLFLTCFCCASAVLGARAQDEHIVIWDNASAPTSSGLLGPTVIEKEVFVANNNVAELFVYKAEEPSGRAVVVCPGGGYHNLAIGYEGHDMARWLAGHHGTTAAVLKYRMPNGHCEVPRNDAEQALRIMREHAAEWGYDASRVGIVGSSAGGHLAASTGTISDEKPAFMILFYPGSHYGRRGQVAQEFVQGPVGQGLFVRGGAQLFARKAGLGADAPDAAAAERRRPDRSRRSTACSSTRHSNATA